MMGSKYKGKRLNTGEWVYGSLITYANGTAQIQGGDDDGIWVDPTTVCGCIGLKDKNGVEVYTDDIDKSGLIVRWNHLHCCFGLFTEACFQKEIVADWIDENGNPPEEWISTELEIIGNIHDNPEILNQ